MSSLNFGNDTAEEKYENFLQDYNEYSDDDLSVFKAQRVATTAWHLIDWIFEDHKATHTFTNLGLFREYLYPNCESLKIMHDLANSTKHLIVNRQKGDIRDTREHGGAFSNAFSDTFNISRLIIEKNDGTILNFKDEIKKVKLFWDNYFIN